MLHATDPATPYLSVRARRPGSTVGDLERALYDDRSLWRLHGMRRTLFIAPAAAGRVVLAGAAYDVARRERRRVTGWVTASTGVGDPDAWLADAEAQVLEALGGSLRSTRELTDAVAVLRTRLAIGPAPRTTTVTLGSRLLLLMAMDGRLVRGRPAGTWRSSQYRWAATAAWFGTDVPGSDAVGPDAERRGRADLARRYLTAHAPATFDDVRWWTGWTVARTRAALTDVGATEVRLDDGVGLTLPDDPAAGDGTMGPDDAGSAARVALLPGLDATTMGWKARGWYVGDLEREVFDRYGNAGPTVWVDGRVVGGWGQTPDGAVVHELLVDVDADARDTITTAADDLGAWLDGVVVRPRFPSPVWGRLSH